MRVSSNVDNFDFPHKYFAGTSAYLWRNKKARIKQFGVWSVRNSSAAFYVPDTLSIGLSS